MRLVRESAALLRAAPNFTRLFEVLQDPLVVGVNSANVFSAAVVFRKNRRHPLVS